MIQSKIDILAFPKPPWIFHVVATHEDSELFADGFRLKKSVQELAFRLLQGSNMETEVSCFNEFSAALQFPIYFGKNWAALNDCLTDLAWLTADIYILFVIDSDRLLMQENNKSLEVLLKILEDACQEWSEPVQQGEWWDRKERAFHVIFHTIPEKAEKLRDRLASINHSIAPWPL